ncbi:MAG TPA: DUF1592 domain-containing protein [Pirellulales bacterium]|nr:DUF1592 domain-containing protein [Pirellulales bacterium]
MAAPRRTRLLVLVALSVLGVGWLGLSLVLPRPVVAGEESPAAISAAYHRQIEPLLKKYCGDCHTGAKVEGKFSLEPLHEDKTRESSRIAWAKMLRKLRTHEMPPKDSDAPQPAERDQLQNWLVAQIKQIDATTPLDPGHVTMRRLNRSEYNNTIRDLVGVDFKPADDFPQDDVGYGFDNIGDVLWLPPILLEKYLAAAEHILDQAIVVPPDKTKMVVKRHDAEKFGKKQGANHVEADRHCYAFVTEGEISARETFPKEDEYLVRIRGFGDQAGNEPCKLSFRVDGKELKVFEFKNKKPRTIEQKLKLPEGAHTISLAFVNDFYDEKVKDPEARDRNLYVNYLEFEGKFTPPEVPESAAEKKIMIARPSGPGDKPEAARKIIQNFANRAFRRTATKVEIDRLMKVWNVADRGGEPFERSIQIALQAALISPQFLFRVELDGPVAPGAAPTTRPLNDFELASRLSYFIWSSMPDDELLSLAFRQQLRPNLEAQVRRMLKDPKSQALVDNFAGQWLQTRRVASLQPDPKRFPSFDPALRDAMRKETELYFTSIMREDRSVLEFLDSDWTFVNERLAKHYGLSGVKGSEFRRVTLPADNPRGGILTQASVLAVTSNPTRTSPVKRGKWVLENLLGTPPPPPPEMFTLPDEKGGALHGTLRQQMEQHRANPSCASCHAQLDPPGFGLENFDAIGAFRTKDNGTDIDPSGELPGNRTFKGPKELKGLLKEQSDLFCHCLAEKMLIYALGRGTEDSDARSLDRLVVALKQNNYKFSSLVIEIAKSEPFQLKREIGTKP